jgi:hypothetical protein
MRAWLHWSRELPYEGADEPVVVGFAASPSKRERRETTISVHDDKIGTGSPRPQLRQSASASAPWNSTTRRLPAR